jgi:glycosyltransferase involved in cell wall biosynthesis
MTTIHLVYPHGPKISCPDAIGRKLAERLRRRYSVRLYDWDQFGEIQPGPEDVLLGHPHPVPWTLFRRSARHPGWKRVIALSPYHHGDIGQVAFLDSIITNVDLYLAITGNYWFNSIGSSVFSHWLPKMIHVDLAVDREDFPPIKHDFNSSGNRRFVYIGHSGWQKNPRYLSQLARMLPETTISWIGSGRKSIKYLKPLGWHDFRTYQAKRLIAEHDFMLTVSHADANPATILEAMAWGLIPVCTPQSGYEGYIGIVNVPLTDLRRAVELLRELQYLPKKLLKDMQQANWELLDKHFNWDRFARQVVEAIESNASPPCDNEPFARKLRIRWAAMISPYSMFRPRMLITAARALVRSLKHG